MSAVQAFTGKRAKGCVTYLRPGYEIVLVEGGRAKWTDQIPLLIVEIIWNHQEQQRVYLLRDTQGTLKWVRGTDMAEAIQEEEDNV